MARLLAPVVALSLLAAACGEVDTPGSQVDDATATQYVDAASFWKTQPERDAWAQMIARIEHDFDDVCGDTFCSGDYSNLTSLGFTCGVSSKLGSTHECVWTFGGSSELVNPTTGALTISKPSFQCRFAPKGQVSKLVTALSGTGADPAIRRPLPGLTTSLYDVLGDCFQHPINATPLAPVYTNAPKYSLGQETDGTDVDAWFSAERALGAAFAEGCPSDFCEGHYPNLTALRLVCATSTTTKNVKSCASVVAGSVATVSSTKGTVTIDARSYRCSLPMKGTVNDLSTLINAPGDTPILDRTLPGSTKTLRAVLDACL